MDSESPPLVLLAAGRARRYGGLKQLAPVGIGGEAIIDLLAFDAFSAGFKKIVVVINPETGPIVQGHIQRHWPATLNTSFVVQTNLGGTVEAVLMARGELENTPSFVVANADDIYGEGVFRQLLEHLTSSTNHCLIGYRLCNSVFSVRPVSRGLCHEVDGRLTEIVERKNVGATLQGFIADDNLEPKIIDSDAIVSMNLWGFHSSILPFMQRAYEGVDDLHVNELPLSTFVGQMIHHSPVQFDVLKTSARCIGVTFEDDLTFIQQLIKNDVISGTRSQSLYQHLKFH